MGFANVTKTRPLPDDRLRAFGEADAMESLPHRLPYDPTMRPRSLTAETLLRVAIGVTLIVALSSGITYWLIYGQLELRALERPFESHAIGVPR